MLKENVWAEKNVVVTWYLWEKIEENKVTNDLWYENGSSSSLYLARNYLKWDTMIVYGDMIIDKEDFEEMKNQDCILVDDKEKWDDYDEYVNKDSLWLKYRSEIWECERFLWAIHLKEETAKKLYKYFKPWMLNYKIWLADLIWDFFDANNIDFKKVKAKNKWFELDKIQDYINAKIYFNDY